MNKILTLITLFMFALCTAVLGQTSPSAGKKMLADRHITEQEVSCADCHNEKNPKSNPKEERCLECHGDWKELASRTEGEEINPHDSHFGESPCSDCHNSHKQSVFLCDQCHSYGTVTP